MPVFSALVAVLSCELGVVALSYFIKEQSGVPNAGLLVAAEVAIATLIVAGIGSFEGLFAPFGIT